jgi:ABC-type uncharacterized transport system YnjBCD ATPase subunit
MNAGDVVTIMGAAGVLITAIAGAIVTLRRVQDVKETLQTDVQAVHKIVNQQRTDMLAYQKVLVDALSARGIHVPTDESLAKKRPGT